MIKIETIRKNLQEIQSYYRIMEMYARCYPRSKLIYPDCFLKMLNQYDMLMDKSPMRIRLAYMNLYRCFKKQKTYAQECGVTEKYIQILNKRIIVYLFNSLNKEQN